MKIFITFCLSVFLMTDLYAQGKELENFQQELNFYIDYTLGKTSFSRNKENNDKLEEKVDKAFREFVAHKDSHLYEKFSAFKYDEANNYQQLDKRILIGVRKFLLNNKVYFVYSYKSANKNNYLVKDNDNNKIVYEGKSKVSFVDNIYWLDENHFLIIENGFSDNKQAIVLSVKEKVWNVTKAFKGHIFYWETNDGPTKQYVEEREVFLLKCNKRHVMFTADDRFGSIVEYKDINKISYNPETKMLSYKRYFKKGKPELITAKWENQTFEIDDYDTNENLSE